MAKLNNANNAGSVSVIIPKKLLQELNWNTGEEVVLQIKDKTLLIKNTKDIEM